MRQLILFVIALFSLLHAHITKAQNLNEDWAKKFSGSNQLTILGNSQVSVDKHGNIYMLSNVRGTVDAGGQATLDSTVHVVLSSWTCQGNFRWMKTFGGTATALTTQVGLSGTQLKTDTMGGVYVFGYCETSLNADSLYWGADTSMKVAPGIHMNYLAKYDTLGQFKWLRTPRVKASPYNWLGTYEWLSVGPSGQVFCVSLLDTGSYDGGNLTVNARQFYALAYNAGGGFQGATPLAMTPPNTWATIGGVQWEFDPVTNRFYGWLALDTSYGSLIIGNTTISPPNPPDGKGILAAFNRQGQPIWLRQSIGNSAVGEVAIGIDGNLYLLGSAFPGTIFCGDTAKNTLGPHPTDYLMALDTNGGFLWSQYAATSNGFGTGIGSSITQRGNTVVVSGMYWGTLSWGTITAPNTTQTYQGYAMSAHASNGTINQLQTFGGSLGTNPSKTVIDKNGNIYLSGSFQGSMTFGGSTFTTPGAGNNHEFLLKYRNAPCNCNLLQPAFAATGNGSKTFQYSYTGNGPYTSISWDFGDGTPAVNSPNPTHTFSAYGIYPVCVTVTNACGSNTACKTLYVTATGVDDISLGESISIYPNPATNELTITGAVRGAQLEIIDVTGRRLYRAQVSGEKETIRVDGAADGLYILRITNTNGQTTSRRFIKH